MLNSLKSNSHSYPPCFSRFSVEAIMGKLVQGQDCLAQHNLVWNLPLKHPDFKISLRPAAIDIAVKTDE